jgi:hypothetical protein
MPPFIRSHALGWASCALAALLARPALSAQIDSTSAAPAREAPAQSTPAPRADEPSVILLKNGTLKHHMGTIVEEEDEYVLKHRAGSVRLKRREVEGIFGSVGEVYRHKVEGLVVGDPDEHMKLARWCLGQKLNIEAREQLKAVLAASPTDERAIDMIKNIEATAENVVRRDDQLKRAGFDSAEGAERDAPATMDNELINQIRSHRGALPKPVVFDLSDALAVKRYQEYLKTIHPLLQRTCASCHDENSGRNFQMIRSRNAKDLQNELLVRNNLAATLGLIDRSNPSHSPLLVNAVMPHGPEKRSILTDSNSPAYRALWTWVESLRQGVLPSAPAPTGTSGPGIGSGVAGYGGGFAAGRAEPTAQPIPIDPAKVPAPIPPAPIEHLEAVHPSVPADADFQTVTPLLGGPNAASIQGRRRPVQPVGEAPAPAPLPALPGALPIPGSTPSGTATGQTITLPDGTQIITQPDGSQVMKLRDGSIAPIMDKAAVANAKKKTTTERKEIHIDSNVLEQFQKGLAPKP